MRHLPIVAILVTAVTILGAAGAAAAETVHTQLDGFQEAPLTLSTTGHGEFRARIRDNDHIDYVLSYADLQGTVTQAHIHFGARAIAGGISAFLCSNLGNGPAGTQACPAAPATISGTIVPANIIGPASQGIAAGEFAELLQAIRAGVAYANVHSTLYPGGEIRGQFPARERDDDD